MKAALRLVALTLVYNLVETGVALWCGIAAGSIALVGFGLDAAIEFAAAAVVLWGLRVTAHGADAARVQVTEAKMYRFVGITFLILAMYVTGQSAWVLAAGQAPEESRLGMVLALLSLTVMPLVARAKMHAANDLGSAALRAEAKETLACSFLSFTLLLGLAANAALGWWWADPVAALLMVPWLVWEGLEGLRGEGHAHVRPARG